MKLRTVLYFLFISASVVSAEDGSRLWLPKAESRKQEAESVGANARITSNRQSPTISVALRELQNYWKGQPVTLTIDKKSVNLKDGYTIRSGANKLTVSAATDAGLLYGAYHLLRLQETGTLTGTPTGTLSGDINITEIPSYDRRILNHWDNLDLSIERGYAGKSLWKWEQLPHTLSPHYEAYARANASIGINGTVLNNVNANPKILNNEYLMKVKALADVFRPYGLTVYLSVNFAAPKTIGQLPTADPLDKAVQQWWKQKVKDIYALIPDFGGFLVKANSEGQSGPQDYGRTHADGANMLADALAPFNGIVMWRAFVYNPTKEDRAKQACHEFVPLDGQFRDNVIIQIKNGPIDFQPREPISPLFGALKHTAEMIEFQITQEYLGHSKHLVYLAPLFEETLRTDTYSGRKQVAESRKAETLRTDADGEGATVAKITDGSLHPAKVTAIAGVANTGDNTNWCGHIFAQSNWYAFGRLAWNHNLRSEQIADEWLRMTFTADTSFLNPVHDMMMTSRETCVDYMMPYGLHHIFSFHEHFGPGPWDDAPGGRPDWMPWYYHNADTAGVGFDRTATGSNAVSQYFPPLNDIYGNRDRCPENLLLWFHHIPWTYRMTNGADLWHNLCRRYDAGVKRVRQYQSLWDKMKPYVDEDRFLQVQSKLKIHLQDAIIWKDACLLYFQTFSRMPIPADVEPPLYELDELKKREIQKKVVSLRSINHYESYSNKSTTGTQLFPYTSLLKRRNTTDGRQAIS
ncbi:MAG: alpha-glucuronidase [Tannerella sp.]|jgi:alpha-glucuronidase|nr:alpha-glucuronidase [Tannerella sp.]